MEEVYQLSRQLQTTINKNLLSIFNCPIINLSNIDPPSADDEILIS